MSENYLQTIAKFHADGKMIGITSVCSAHHVVIRAALRRAKLKSQPVLIEATCNQVNQFGGYTGMTPADFVSFVRSIADEEGVQHNKIIFGGDHLGPNPWRKEPADIALQKASDLVAAYVAAGFNKIHLDASMGCAGEPVALDNQTVATRAAALCARAEDEAHRLGIRPPVYILGTEVPIPGGVDHLIDSVEPTSPEAAKETIDIHRQAFTKAGLSDAFSRVIAFVVQPGVEFGSDNVLPFEPQATQTLSDVLHNEANLLFEAHSTDYQSEQALTALVQGGFAILKVGPELTFAYREALYRLDFLAAELSIDYVAPQLRHQLEQIMLDEPSNWRSYYHGDEAALKLQRHYSYSDRIRYYWNEPKAEAAVERLLTVLNSQTVPETLQRQFLPNEPITSAFKPEDILIAAVDHVLERYDRAAGVLDQ